MTTWRQTRDQAVVLLAFLITYLFQLSLAHAQVTFSGSWWYNGVTYDNSGDAIGSAVHYIGVPAPPDCAPSGDYYFSGSLSISNGAVLTDAGGQIGASDSGPPCSGSGSSDWYYIGPGSVVVDGPGSTWQTSELIYNTNGTLAGGQYGITLGGGYADSPGFLTIQNGGLVQNYGYFNIGASGSYGSVVVNGQGSVLILSQRTAGPGASVSIGGAYGGWGQLIITNGGVVSLAEECFINSSSDGISSMIVDGTGSSLLMTNYGLAVSSRAANVLSSIIVRNGGSVVDAGTWVDYASVLVDGAGTTWSNLSYSAPSGGLSIGNGSSNSSASFTIQNRGLVYVGDSMGVNDGNHLTVSGSGSTLIVQTKSLSLGNANSQGATVNVQNGGNIKCLDTAGGYGGVDISPGTIVTVNGDNSSIVCSGASYVNGTLMVLNGGTLTSAGNISVGGTPPGMLGGNGTVNGSIFIGNGGTLIPSDGAGGFGTLTVNGNVNQLDQPMFCNFSIGASNSQIAVSNNLDLNGTLNMTILPGVAAGSYTLFTYGGALTLDTVKITGPASFSYAINTNTPGKVNLVLTSNPPSFVGASRNGSNLVLNCTSGYPNQNFYIITSTNLTLPLSQWSIVGTNQSDSVGNFTFTDTIGLNAPQQFYSIKMP